MQVRKSPLDRVHREAGGRMVEFAGWSLPVQYSGALEEHLAVRRSAGVFDVSHMGQIELRGPDATAMCQRVTCNDVTRLSDGQAQYSAFLTPRGTFIDDIVVYRFHSERIFICVNAATTGKDYAWLLENRSGNVEVVNRSEEYAQIAVQGPRSIEVLQQLTDTDLESIRFYWFREGEIAGVPAILSRTGYTGESGFELYVDPERAPRVWGEVMAAGSKAGIRPAGLAARNTLRLEMKYPLYGNDIDEDHTPLEAGLGWIVKLGTGFVGEDVLIEQKQDGVSRRLAGFELVEPGIVRDGCEVLIDGRSVGRATSGGYAPSLSKSIGLAYLPVENGSPGQPLEVEIRGKMKRAQVVETPFFRRPA